MELFAWRKRPAFGRPEAVVLAVYAAALMLAVAHHAPWGDEAQAWLLARDNTFSQLLLHRMHYEGAPALWHTLLRTFHLMGGTWGGVRWLAAAFATGGAYVLLRWSPFPPVVRWLLPFTFFLQYQYAVIARSYVLFPLLLFGLCALYRSPVKRPVALALVAGLLANISMQGFVVSVSFTAMMLWRHWRQRRAQAVPALRFKLPAAIFAALVLLAFYCAIPAPDVDFAVSDTVSDGLVHRVLVSTIGEMPGTRKRVPPTDPLPPKVKPAFWTSPAGWLAFQNDNHSTGPLGDTPNVVWEGILTIMGQAAWPVARSNWLAIAFWTACIVWARKRRETRMLLPVAALLLLGCVLYVADHHLGLILLTALAGIWIAADESSPTSPRVERTFLALLTLVLLLQAGWSISCIRRERTTPYDPGAQMARLLKAEPAGTRMAAFHFLTTATQPYFDRNPFFNLHQAWWPWSANAESDADFRATIAQHPDVVLYAAEAAGLEPMRNQWVPLNPPGVFPSDPVLRALFENGYQITDKACGDRFTRLSTSYRVCDLLLRRR